MYNSGDFDMCNYPKDELPALQKTSSELVHAQKIKRAQKQTTVTYKFETRKKSTSGVDKKEKARQGLAQYTGGNITESNSVQAPLILK